MTTRYRVAALQFEPELGAKDRNLDRLLALCTVAAQAGARLIVTPEMATTGYCWYDRAEVAPFVEPIPGPTTERFTALARAYGCYVVVGMPEVDPTTERFTALARAYGCYVVVGMPEVDPTTGHLLQQRGARRSAGARRELPQDAQLRQRAEVGQER